MFFYDITVIYWGHPENRGTAPHVRGAIYVSLLEYKIETGFSSPLDYALLYGMRSIITSSTTINYTAVLPRTSSTIYTYYSACHLQEIASRERELREEEATELARERQEAARRKVERERKRRADEVEAKFLREKQIALAQEVGVKQLQTKTRVCVSGSEFPRSLSRC